MYDQVESHYDYACDFGVYIVKKEDKYGIISGKGKTRVPIIFDKIEVMIIGIDLFFLVEKGNEKICISNVKNRL
jgi:hypothetical protein